MTPPKRLDRPDRQVILVNKLKLVVDPEPHPPPIPPVGPLEPDRHADPASEAKRGVSPLQRLAAKPTSHDRLDHDRTPGSRFRFQGLGFRVRGQGILIQHLVQGLGFRV